jgi:hypothetical protein
MAWSDALVHQCLCNPFLAVMCDPRIRRCNPTLRHGRPWRPRETGITPDLHPPAPPSSRSARECSPSPGMSVTVRGKSVRSARHRRPDDQREFTPEADHPLAGAVMQQLATFGLNG